MLCGLCLIMDGFDVQAMGYVAPAVIREFKIPGPQMGLVFSAALLGVLLGSFLFSMLSDRIGRRPVLIAAAFYFAVLTLWTATASSANQLLAIRFIAGFGLGGIMPNAMALAGEYSPARIRVTVMMLVANFFTVGAAIGGFIAAGLIPRFGWRSVFIFGGIVPLIIALLMIFLLPESLQFMVLRGKSNDKVVHWLKRIHAPVPAGEVVFVVNEENRKGVPVINLFREGRGLGTAMLWIINFMNLLNLYFLGKLAAHRSPRRRLHHGDSGAGGDGGAGWRIRRHHPERLDDQPLRLPQSINDSLRCGHHQYRHDRTAVAAALHVVLRGIRGGLVRARRTTGREFAGGDVLSDVPPVHRNRRQFRLRTHRRDRGPSSRRCAAGQRLGAPGTILRRCYSRTHFGGGDLFAALGDAGSG